MDRLPDEIHLHILSYLSPRDLWSNARHINQKYSQYAEEIAIKHHIPHFTIGLNFTLTSGSTYRWYDVWGTVTTSFRNIHKVNPQYALFEVKEVIPENYKNRIKEKWQRICASGVGPEQEWRVTFRGDGILVKLPNLVLSTEDGIWCDWREMMEGHIARRREAWEGYARPSD